MFFEYSGLFFVKPIEIYFLFQMPFAQANTAIKRSIEKILYQRKRIKKESFKRIVNKLKE